MFFMNEWKNKTQQEPKIMVHGNLLFQFIFQLPSWLSKGSLHQLLMIVLVNFWHKKKDRQPILDFVQDRFEYPASHFFNACQL